jgi:hypothetical protein
MKRSEMVKKLTLPIALISGGLLTETELAEVAEGVLRLCEKQGMLPPCLDKDPDEVFPRCRWEDEYEG